MEASDFRVVVTRPAHQAAELCELIAAEGWQVVRFPTIRIEQLNDIHLPVMRDYSCLIFTSRNAVEAAFRVFDKQDFDDKHIIAIGQATTSLLKENGLQSVISPQGISNSEQLLLIPELKPESIADQSILIFSGVGGRTLLQNSLSRNAREVATLALYERSCPCYDINEIDSAWCAQPNALVLTSNEAADNLLKILDSTAYQSILKQIPTIVMSERNRQHIQKKGFHAKNWIAETTDVSGLINALKQCFKEEQSE